MLGGGQWDVQRRSAPVDVIFVMTSAMIPCAGPSDVDVCSDRVPTFHRDTNGWDVKNGLFIGRMEYKEQLLHFPPDGILNSNNITEEFNYVMIKWYKIQDVPLHKFSRGVCCELKCVHGSLDFFVSTTIFRGDRVCRDVEKFIDWV